MLYSKIHQFTQNINTSNIPEKRKKQLEVLQLIIEDKIALQSPIALNFICTHNSRRSHLAQIWAQTWAYYFKIPQFYAYSGGTETTALFPKILETLTNQGFTTHLLSKEKNPVYSIRFSPITAPIIGFSKEYSHPYNPPNEFIAVMTCTQADKGCPIVSGASRRVTLSYEDPKIFDNTPLQTHKYQERSIEIATELFYLFGEISKWVDRINLSKF